MQERLEVLSQVTRDGMRYLARATRRRPLPMSFLWVILFCGLSMLLLDRPLALFFKANLSPHVEGFFKVITELGRAEWYYIPMLGLWGWFRFQMYRAHVPANDERLRRLSWVALYPVFTLAASGLLVNLTKFLFGRYRPRYLFEQDLYGFGFFNAEWAMNSFPSGHSQAIWAVMMSLVFIFPRYDLAWITIAALVAASRFITTVHYLSDTVMGAYVAIVCAILIRRLYAAKGIDVHIRLARDARLHE